MSPATFTERRRSPRRKPPQLVYLEFGRENGGMIKDVSEGGVRFHLMNPVTAGQSFRFVVAMDVARRIEGQARIVWTDGSGKSGGLSFAELTGSSAEILRAWLAEMDGSGEAGDTVPESMVVPVLVAPVLGAPIPAAATVTPPAAQTQLAAQLRPARSGAPSPSQVTTIAPHPSPTSATLSTSPAATTQDAPEAMLEVGSQFIAQPVAREVWQRAAREEIAPGERSRRPLTSAKVRAMREDVLAATRPAAPALAEPGNSLGELLEAKPLEDKAREAVFGDRKDHPETLEQAPDPLRDFLRRPIGGAEFPEVRAGDYMDSAADAEDFREPRSAGWTTSRVAMIFALAAICGMAGTIAGIAYRQTVGESLIRLGEKISGEPRPASGVPPEAPSSSPNGNADSPSTPRAAEKPANGKKKAGRTPDATPDASPAPQSTAPISQQIEPATPAPQSQAAPLPAVVQTQLASSRELVPGKPKRPPDDVASLWIAVENGDTGAEIALANRYVGGEGVDKNCEQARVLLQAAAKHGNEAATKRLAQLAAAGCQ
jgi:hypothetical protein